MPRPDPDDLAALRRAAEAALTYVEGIDERPVVPDAAALAGLAAFDEPLPGAGAGTAATLALLDAAGSPATVASTGGRDMGFVTGATLPAALGAASAPATPPG